jgi:hypothetical protein
MREKPKMQTANEGALMPDCAKGRIQFIAACRVEEKVNYWTSLISGCAAAVGKTNTRSEETPATDDLETEKPAFAGRAFLKPCGPEAASDIAIRQ